MNYWPQQLNLRFGARQLAAEFRVKFSTRITQLWVFLHRCTRSIRFTSILLSD